MAEHDMTCGDAQIEAEIKELEGIVREGKERTKKRRAHGTANAITGRKPEDRDASRGRRRGKGTHDDGGGKGQAAPSSAGAAQDGSDNNQGGGGDAEAAAEVEAWAHGEEDGASAEGEEPSESPSDFFVEALDPRELKKSGKATPLEVCVNVHACVHACVRVFVHACERACVRKCVGGVMRKLRVCRRAGSSAHAACWSYRTSWTVRLPPPAVKITQARVR